MISLKEIAWLAGLLEGEGSFMFTIPPTRSSGYPRISIQSSDFDTIYKVHKLMNTYGITSLSPRRIKGNPGRIQIYMTVQSKIKETIGWMMTLYPLMSERRQAKIKEIINQWKLAIDGRVTDNNNFYKQNKAKKEGLKKWKLSIKNQPFINPFKKIVL